MAGPLIKARADDVWSAIRDVRALHTGLVPGFVTDTRLEGSVNIVTFGNGMVLREPIVTIDEQARRPVWSAEGGRTKHYNAALEVIGIGDGSTRVVWTADFLRDTASSTIAIAMGTGMAVMKKTLDQQA